MQDSDKFPFDLDFQKRLLKLLIDDSNFLIKSTKYLKKEFFDTEQLQWVYKIVVDYYDKYGKVITPLIFKSEIIALNGKVNELEYISVVQSILTSEVTEREFIISKVEEFIKRNIFVSKFKEAATLYNNNKFDLAFQEVNNCIDNINKVSFEQLHRTFFFDEANDREHRRIGSLQSQESKFASCIFELDAITNGGLGRGEVGLVIGDAKVGKSICLLNIGVAGVMTFNKVLHINLEGKDGQVEDRYDSRLLGTKYVDVTKNKLPDNYQAKYRRYGNSLVICNFIDKWDYTVVDIEQEINELKTFDFVPDVIIIDYADLLSARTISKENKYGGQEEVYRDLKILSTKHNCAIWTASQVHRVAKDVKPEEDSNFVYTRRNLADCYAKIRIVDLAITLNMTNDERRNKRLRLYVDAYRDAECGMLFSLNTDYEKMKFCIPTMSSMNMLNKSYIDG